VSVSSGGTFDLNGVTDTVDSVSGSGTILLGGGELRVDANSGFEVFSGNISESGTFRKMGSHALTLSGNNGFTSLILEGGTTSISNSNNLGASSATVLLSSTLNVTGSLTNARGIFLANGTFDIDSGDTLTQTGVIENNTTAASLTKNGSGTMVLGASNTYTGDTILNSGRLEINSNNRINNSSDLIVNGGTFDMNNRTETVGGLGGTGGTIDTGGSSGRLTIDQSETRTYSGVIAGAGGITKRGNGTLTLDGNNTYDGSTSVQDGTLRLGSSGGLDSTTDVMVSSGATFDLNGRSDTVDSISGAGNITLGGATLSVDQSSGTKTFSGVISESGGISKSGGHQLILSGNNSFTGGVLISDGSVSVGADNNLGASSGDITLIAAGELETTGSFTTMRDVRFSIAANGTIDTATGTTLTHSGSLIGGTDVTFNKAGDGTYRLNAANAGFGGDIVVQEGTFEIASFTGDALSTSTRITVNSGATLLNNQLEFFGSLAGAGSVVTNNTFAFGFDNTSPTYSGVISGNVGGGYVGKNGSGSMTITQPQTYLGATRVDGGTLRLSGSGGLPDASDVRVNATWDLNNVSDTIDALTGSGSVLLGTGTLTFGNNNGSGTFSGVISESGSASTGAIVKVGSGTQTLTGNNSYSNAAHVQGGQLEISDANALGFGIVNITNGARLQVTGSTLIGNAISVGNGGGVFGVRGGRLVTQLAPIFGSGAFEKAGGGTLELNSTGTYGGSTGITGGILQLKGNGRLPNLTDVDVFAGGAWDLNGLSDTVGSVSGSGSILLGGGTLTVISNDGLPRTFSGVISESGALVKGGIHTLSLSGNNTFTGPISVLGPGGALSISSNSNLGNAANALTLDGGTLQTTAGVTTPRAVTLTSNDGILDTLSNELTVTGVVSGNGRLIKRGIGNLFLLGSNTYTGGTVIENGSVEVESNSALGANTGAITLANGTLLISDEFTNLHPIVISGSGSIDTSNQAHFVDLPITGMGTLSKLGTGELELNAAATYIGNTTIEAGELRSVGLPDLFDVELGDPTANWRLMANDTIDALLGTGTVFLGGNTLTLGGGDGGDFFGGTLQGAGDLVLMGSGTHTLGGINSYDSTNINQATLVVSQNSNLGAAGAPIGFNEGWLNTTATFTMPRDVTLNTLGGTFDVDGSTTLTLANPVTGPGGLTKRGAGTLILLAANDFGGPMTVLDGSVQIGTGMTFGGLSGNGDVNIGLNELIVDNTGDDIYGGVLSGIGGKLTKDGPGTLTLTGINTYTGGTCINDGVLRISQSENLGELGSLITFDGGTLNTTADFSMIRGIAINAGGGTIDVDTATTLDEGSLHTSSSISTERSTTVGAGGGTFRTDALTTRPSIGATCGLIPMVELPTPAT